MQTHNTGPIPLNVTTRLSANSHDSAKIICLTQQARHTVVILRTLSHGLNPCDNEQKSPAGVAVAPSPELIAQAAEVSSNQRISATADSDAIFVANINNIGESRRHLAVRLLFHGTRPKSSHRGAHPFRQKMFAALVT
ncbi:hypothetical protein CRENBAI_018909 [Crenichthys baileyi]|uniref:Uncharacterized protein n=1 Tax=Crenichthys baileyi TaxID=28760 RepID=A0AAV9QT04_9TELE